MSIAYIRHRLSDGSLTLPAGWEICTRGAGKTGEIGKVNATREALHHTLFFCNQTVYLNV
jgi:hypothetical protein